MFLHGLVSMPHIRPTVSVAVALQTCACRDVTGYWKFRRTLEDNIKTEMEWEDVYFIHLSQGVDKWRLLRTR